MSARRAAAVRYVCSDGCGGVGGHDRCNGVERERLAWQERKERGQRLVVLRWVIRWRQAAIAGGTDRQTARAVRVSLTRSRQLCSRIINTDRPGSPGKPRSAKGL